MIIRSLRRLRRSFAWGARCVSANTPYRRSLRALAIASLPGSLVLPRDLSRGLLRDWLDVEIDVVKDDALIRMTFPGGDTLFTPADGAALGNVNWTRCWELLYDHWVGCCVLDQYFTGDLLHRNMTVIDVGANVGAFALAASRRIGPSSRMVLIEPDARNVTALRRSVSENYPGKADVVPVAAGGCNGSLKLYCGRARTGVNTTVESRAPDRTRFVEVEQRTLDSIVNELQVEPDFIKIDVEGSEPDVLRGAFQTLERFRPIVVAAAYHESEHPELISHLIEDAVPDYSCEVRCASYDAETEIIAMPPERQSGRQGEWVE